MDGRMSVIYDNIHNYINLSLMEPAIMRFLTFFCKSHFRLIQAHAAF